MARYLLVAHQTADSPELRAKVLGLARDDPDAEFVLVVPATQIGYLLELEEGASGSPLTQARLRAQRARDSLSRAGVPLTATRIGHYDPLTAIEEELRSGVYKAVVISTLPHGLSRWLRMDLPAQVSRRYPKLDVMHVMARRTRAEPIPRFPAGDVRPPGLPTHPVQLTLEPEEVALVLRVLTYYLSDLRMEIRTTDRRQLRQELEGEESALSGLLNRLSSHIGEEPAAEASASAQS